MRTNACSTPKRGVNPVCNSGANASYGGFFLTESWLCTVGDGQSRSPISPSNLSAQGGFIWNLRSFQPLRKQCGLSARRRCGRCDNRSYGSGFRGKHSGRPLLAGMRHPAPRERSARATRRAALQTSIDHARGHRLFDGRLPLRLGAVLRAGTNWYENWKLLERRNQLS